MICNYKKTEKKTKKIKSKTLLYFYEGLPKINMIFIKFNLYRSN